MIVSLESVASLAQASARPGETLVGLKAAVAIDAASAAASVPRNDRNAPTVPRRVAAGADRPAARARFAFAARNAAPSEPAAAPGALQALAEKLRDALAATPDFYVTLVEASWPDDSQLHAMALAILDAAIAPGWPASSELLLESHCALAPLLGLEEREVLEHARALAGAGPSQPCLEAAAGDPSRGSRLLRAMLVLVVVVVAIVTALRVEIEEILSGFGLIENAAAPKAWGGRIRIPVV